MDNAKIFRQGSSQIFAAVPMLEQKFQQDHCIYIFHTLMKGEYANSRGLGQPVNQHNLVRAFATHRYIFFGIDFLSRLNVQIKLCKCAQADLYHFCLLMPRKYTVIPPDKTKNADIFLKTPQTNMLWYSLRLTQLIG